MEENEKDAGAQKTIADIIRYENISAVIAAGVIEVNGLKLTSKMTKDAFLKLVQEFKKAECGGLK